MYRGTRRRELLVFVRGTVPAIHSGMDLIIKIIVVCFILALINMLVVAFLGE